MKIAIISANVNSINKLEARLIKLNKFSSKIHQKYTLVCTYKYILVIFAVCVCVERNLQCNRI